MLICDMWGRWTFSQNFSSLALRVWELRCFGDNFTKDDLLTDLRSDRGVCKNMRHCAKYVKLWKNIANYIQVHSKVWWIRNFCKINYSTNMQNTKRVLKKTKRYTVVNVHWINTLDCGLRNYLKELWKYW